MQKTITKSNRRIGKSYRRQKKTRLKRAHRNVLRSQRSKKRRA